MAKQEQKNEQTPKTSKKWKAPAFVHQRSFRYGSAATAFTIIFIVAVILVNVLVTALSARFPLSADMTANHKSQLSAKSISYIQKINQDINIDILADQSAYTNAPNYNSCLLIMQQYAQHNSHIHINFINLDKSPTYAAKYPKETLSAADIIVSSGSNYKHIASSDLLTTSSDSTTGSSTVTGNNTEQQIDTAIAYVTAKSLPTVMVSSGHNETDSSSLTSLMQKNNYQIETKNLSTDGVDQNAKMIIINAPTADFTADEITKLDTFLTNGGKYGKTVFLVFDPQQASMPNLESFAAKWGIGVGTGVVYDTTNRYQDSYFNVLEGQTNSTYVGTLQSGLHAYLSVCRPLSLLFNSQDGVTTASIVATESTSKLWNPGTVNSSTASSFQPADSDKAGPFNVFAVATKTATSGSESVKSNVLVLGSTNFFNSSVIAQSSLTNSTILLNTLSNVIGFNPGITVEAKDLTSQALTITSGQAVAIVVIFAILLPIAVLVTGLVIWLRRRHQ
ncbi:MAG: Gldg family protein [Ethanoligenens sp.]